MELISDSSLGFVPCSCHAGQARCASLEQENPLPRLCGTFGQTMRRAQLEALQAEMWPGASLGTFPQPGQTERKGGASSPLRRSAGERKCVEVSRQSESKPAQTVISTLG